VASFDPTIPQAEPNQNVAAEALDHRHAFPWLPLMPGMCARRTFGKPLQYLVDQ
jgi:hypothetical protein